MTDAADLVRERLPAGGAHAARRPRPGLGPRCRRRRRCRTPSPSRTPSSRASRSGSVAGHAGRLVVGTLAGVPVAVLQGRAHLYEGVDPGALAVPVRTVRALGAELILLTNAAGSLRAEVGPGGSWRSPTTST